MSTGFRIAGWIALTLAAGLPGSGPDAAAQDVARGAELFVHEWQAGDALSAEGDGLGPLYNAKSCVACHRQGGTGGAGPDENNVDLISRTPAARSLNENGFVELQKQLNELAGNPRRPDAGPKPKARTKSPADKLGQLHPALGAGPAASGTTILHRHAVDEAYDFRRLQLLGLNVPRNPTERDRERLEAALEKRERRSNSTRDYEVAGVSVTLAHRQTPALFGTGLIDAIPDAVLWNVANSQVGTARGISGRVAMGQPERPNPYGRADDPANAARPVVGKFGWRGQTGSLRQFVLNACANELGLDVPTRSQPLDPRHPDRAGPGLDLRSADCEALVAFVVSLPPPTRNLPSAPEQLERVRDGERIFSSVGCAECHRSSMGDVEGLYSDLLLHDLGADLADPIAAAAATVPLAPIPFAFVPPIAGGNVQRILDFYSGRLSNDESLQREWRTPPLWGVRDSAPYLHDGRAVTLDDAIRMHGGEATQVVKEYKALAATERRKLLAFLESL